ncbi:MAG: KTSC domain-containing protein [Hydrogenophaga sp.]|uniref:KTSC domain-containing protein n=1 Tax=Hydrogenophaga sp. TaxID=1904254 RepID=UPI002735218D|nr:KTSC domain-containing protein [Hydrogenophaga sp.]MDP3351848.1 KTSC domain-containing protein [Hydrogenophaga sp.]
MTTNPSITIDFLPCESSQIMAFGYDADSQTLAIKFAPKGTVYHYAEVPQQVFDDMKTAASKGTFFGSTIRGRYAYEKQPDATGVVFGLKTAQEPKYTTGSKDGRLVNRASGKPIPDDEPVFVLRAQDIYAVHALVAYLVRLDDIDDDQQIAAVEARLKAFEDFAAAHPERMKQPDTAAA